MYFDGQRKLCDMSVTLRNEISRPASVGQCHLLQGAPRNYTIGAERALFAEKVA